MEGEHLLILAPEICDYLDMVEVLGKVPFECRDLVRLIQVGEILRRHDHGCAFGRCQAGSQQLGTGHPSSAPVDEALLVDRDPSRGVSAAGVMFLRILQKDSQPARK